MTESADDLGETATALLDAAEIAFARDGVDRVSLRSIMRDAGANPASVHYHFRSREGLARAVLDRLLEPIQARRLELLDGLTAGGTPPSVEALVEALIRPDLEAAVTLGRRDPARARLVGTISIEPSAFVQSLVEESFAPVAIRFQQPLAAALPHLPPAELGWRVRWGVFGTVGAYLADLDTVVTAATVERDLARLVLITAGALRAPAPEPELEPEEETP